MRIRNQRMGNQSDSTCTSCKNSNGVLDDLGGLAKDLTSVSVSITPMSIMMLSLGVIISGVAINKLSK